MVSRSEEDSIKRVLRRSRAMQFLLVIGVSLLFFVVAFLGDRFGLVSLTVGELTSVSSGNSQPDPKNPIGFGVSVRVTPPPIARRSSPIVELQRFELEIIKNQTFDPDEVCISKLIALEGLEQDRVSIPTFDSTYFPLCFKLNQANYRRGPPDSQIAGYWLVPDVEVPIRIALLQDARSYWYPYDSYKSTISFVLTYNLIADDSVVFSNAVAPEITISVLDEFDWEVSIEQIPDLILSNPHRYQAAMGISSSEFLDIFHRVGFSFFRPLFLRIVYIVVVVTMFLMIAILPSIESLDTFIEGSLAVLFGIFGIREVLISPSADIRTMMDVVILGMYVAYGVALLLYIGAAFSARKQQEDRQVSESIDNKVGVYELPPHAIVDDALESTDDLTNDVEGGSGDLVNINTASAAELETLVGIGPAMAQKLIDHHEVNGCFECIEDIQNVPGIGRATFEGLENLIAVE